MLQLHKTKLVEPEKEVFYSLWSLGTYRILIRGCLHGKLRNKCDPASSEVFKKSFLILVSFAVLAFATLHLTVRRDKPLSTLSIFLNRESNRDLSRRLNASRLNQGFFNWGHEKLIREARATCCKLNRELY